MDTQKFVNAIKNHKDSNGYYKPINWYKVLLICKKYGIKTYSVQDNLTPGESS